MSKFDDLLAPTTSGHQHMARPYNQMAEALRTAGTVTDQQSKAVVSMESRNSMQEADVASLQDLRGNMQATFESIHAQLTSLGLKDANGKHVQGIVTLENRTRAALAGLLMASDKSGSALIGQTLAAPSAKGSIPTTTVAFSGQGAHQRRTIATAEAFSTYDMQNSRIFSALFNYSIVDFDDFIRTFWRPVTISPDCSFVELLVNVLTVFNGYEHDAAGKAKSWKRSNLVRAIADHRILHTNATRAVPVVSVNAAEFFMTPALVGSSVLDIAGNAVTTAPLKAGVTGLDYIGLCQPDFVVKAGMLDQRDGLDPGVRMDKVFIALAGDVLEFSVKGLPGSEFAAAPQGDRQLEVLNWTTASFLVNKKTLQADGTPLVDLASVVTGELTLKIRVDFFSQINIETGELNTTVTRATVRSLIDKDGNAVAAIDARYTTLVTALNGLVEVGYTLDAYRSNADRRQRGQLINIRQFAESVVVPWRDPIAAERPSHSTTEGDTADLTALISATRVRIHNEGITAILDAEQVIKSTVSAGNFETYEAPDSLGVGRHYVLPEYRQKTLDMLQIVDSLKSSDRTADIQAAIVSTLRNELAHAYTNSQYKAASDALSGGTAPKPKVAIVCDPVTARYILEPGDLRTLVDFEMIVVPVLDFRMRGKLKMVFITDDGGTDVNYLNFGYLFWSPEHVLIANMTRSGAYNRETQVQPRYRFYVACPVMVSIDITNIEQALAKLPMNILDTTPVVPGP